MSSSTFIAKHFQPKVKETQLDSNKVDDQPSSYIGFKGYTILKSCLEESELKYIRETLNVRPHIPNSPIKMESFNVYRESNKKIYVPRFWGINTYGVPDEMKLTNNIKIDLCFKGELRDYQENIIDTYMKHVSVDSKENPNVKKWGGGGLLEIPCGRGKTIMALNIISKLKTKTLIVVHKEFLMNQWIERIQQFLPDARVGKIQGKTLDIDNKDIVIGMLQSLSMKEYPDNMFESFGLTIIDECHHISSEVFSRSLQRIVTKYVLGLSATMDRKDGLTNVFKMFLGEVIYKESRDLTDIVTVKGIEYKTDDEEFNETVYDFRGNPAFSTMITKLCQYSHRSEFILRVLKRELEIKKDQQIMILAHNKSLLSYLYKAIEHREIASVGYYVGGMKEVDLKKSETKQIIIATYSMASEALDIKTLTTLVFATPRTDVVQSVGRILRVKHERPLIIDIIDSHDMFKRQWSKRRQYYNKCNYNVLYTTSKMYESTMDENAKWKKNKRMGMGGGSVFCGNNKDEEASDDDDSHMRHFTKGNCMIDQYLR
jgi:superfamily II DNA or RNA helicase